MIRPSRLGAAPRHPRASLRPDRFIAARLAPGRDLDVLQPFAAALTAAAPHVAA